LVVVTFIAWLAVLITASYPKGLHEYTSGVMRWGARVYAYAISLTDEFPPFSLSPDAGAGKRSSQVISAVIGGVALLGLAGVFTAMLLNAQDEEVVRLSYDELLKGDVTQAESAVSLIRLNVALTDASDPAGPELDLLETGNDKRLVSFRVTFQTLEDRSIKIKARDFELKDDSGDEHDVFFMLVNGRPEPHTLREESVAVADVVFEIDEGAVPRVLRFDRASPFQKDIVWRFE
jgi:hypothetical protein